MNVLSLFDGLGCARLALNDLGIKVDNYFSSEIDPFCIKVLNSNFDDIIHLGDVRDIDLMKLPKIDLLIGGSPCQDLSNAFKGKGITGDRSNLFNYFVSIKDEINPDYFILENVKNKWIGHMNHEMGVEGQIINSHHFSSQSRPRCYWTNILFEQNEDILPISIKDILEDNVEDERYFFSKDVDDYMQSLNIDQTKFNDPKKINVLTLLPRTLIKDNERQRRVYSVGGKCPTLLARSDTPKIYLNRRVRKLTPLECERIQGIPDNYTKYVSNTQRYKMIGNGFSVPTISSLLKNMGRMAPVQTKVFK